MRVLSVAVIKCVSGLKAAQVYSVDLASGAYFTAASSLGNNNKFNAMGFSVHDNLSMDGIMQLSVANALIIHWKRYRFRKTQLVERILWILHR